MNDRSGSTPRRRIATALGCIVLIAWAYGAAALAGESELERTSTIVVRVDLRDRVAGLDRLNRLGLDIDGVFDGWARVYCDPRDVEKLRELGFEVTQLVDEGKIGLERLSVEGVAQNVGPQMVPAQYHDYATLTSDLQAIATDHPDVTRLTSIGQSVQGRELWMMKITSDPDLELDKPEVAYIAAMHGDEVVGKELTFNLINYLTDNYGSDPRVTDMVDDLEIWIMPSMNPDGTAMGQRYNANGADLNRDFPDLFSDPVNTPDGREPETALVMAWTASRNIVLSANFHGGALLAQYPFDNNPTGSSVYSPPPDPDQPPFYSICRTYADNNPPMYANMSFDHGVTNGAEWYAISGGMQDWNYGWYGNFQITVEASYDKWPAATTLPQYWTENQESMLSFLERAYEGLRGVVTDAENGAPLAATVHIDSNPYPSYTDPDVGDWHRLVMPGSYSIEVSAVGYASQVIPVTVTAGAAARYDVALQSLDTDLQHHDHRVEDGLGGDGWLDPGETADLAVTLYNLGRSATSVNAKLVPTGWFAEITRTDATYPDIGTAETGESDSPYYAVSVDPSIPTGHKVGFALQWQTDQGSGTSEPFFLGVGGPWCSTVDATDVPQPILDNQTTTSLLDVVSAGTLTDVVVPVDISHTYIGDLIVTLTSPSAISVVLHDRSGGSASDIVGSYGDGLTPAQPLSVLNGESANGIWQLDVSDNAGADTGTLNAWSLQLCDEPVEASTPEMRLRDLAVDPGGVLLRWWPYPGLDSYKVYRATDPSSPGNFLDVTAEDGDDTDTRFLDTSTDARVHYLVTGVGPQGEGPR